jgi:hypothetical protein
MPRKKGIYKGGAPTKTKVKQGYMRKSIRANNKRLSLKKRGR